MKYVIIGNSAAAIGCVEGIREVDKKGSITIISDENHHTYSRPLISYLLYGKTDRQRMKYREDSFYDDNDCNTLLGTKVVNIDIDKKNVETDSGKKIEYDKLLLATGSSPFVPRIEGFEKVENKTCFMTLDDADNLEKMINKDSRVLIVGAGLIGLKCAEGIADRVKNVTVCDLASRILPNVLDERSAQIVKEHIEKKNINIILNNSVSVLEKNKATLASGDSVEFDVLIMAVGVRPNVKLISDVGANVAKGVIIDENCKTSINDVFAAGDCTESIDAVTGEQKIIAILPNAYMQGKCAGINMAGKGQKIESLIAMNAVGFFGLHILTAGSYEGESVFTHEDDGTYKRLIVKDNVLKGFILVGDVARAGIYTNMIREKMPLDTLDFELVAEKPQLMAFSKVKRDEIFRGQAR
ncbi:MAG: NAD(P)/FAD-dependent oxidoreductase [Clostridia bacterium]|nr:NAD(P)/FAD-dependent oxidoreductase [Clostridia bacterium]